MELLFLDRTFLGKMTFSKTEVVLLEVLVWMVLVNLGVLLELDILV